jgi:2-oxo-4-hydroxy-4-carboxy--5-ureidoimidazoline (OHCU) decarboxylase
MNIANPDRKADSELELRLQAYMALYHIHPEIKSPLVDEELVLDLTAERLENFKRYLAAHGSQFSSDDRYLGYFSLPYVLSVDTEKNEAIKTIFEKQWIDNLEASLNQAVEEMCRLSSPSLWTYRRG